MTSQNIDKHIITLDCNVKIALSRLNDLGIDNILFVVDENKKLIGSLTDGDIRRGIIINDKLEESLEFYIKRNPISIYESKIEEVDLNECKEAGIKIIPILNQNDEIIDIFNFRIQNNILPVDVVIMAGGKGKRLLPLTQNTPKPLIKVGEKPIIEHNVDRLIKFGIKNIIISINYLGDQIIHYFNDTSKKDIKIDYVNEYKPMGTIGSILLVEQFDKNDILIMNSDLLTNINFSDLYKTFKETNADMIVASTSYNVDVPYAVLEVNNNFEVKSLKEKPRYTYFSNAGIYIIKKNILDFIPKDTFYDITDLMENILSRNMKLVTYPITDYWLDIGKHEDLKKAQEDIKHIVL